MKSLPIFRLIRHCVARGQLESTIAQDAHLEDTLCPISNIPTLYDRKVRFVQANSDGREALHTNAYLCNGRARTFVMLGFQNYE